MLESRLLRRFLKVAAILSLLAIAGLFVLILVVWVDHKKAVTLPSPTGPLAVGRIVDVWTDKTHSDDLAPTPDTPRELVVWIWYPADPDPTAPMDDYLPAHWRAAIEHHRGSLVTFLTRDLSRVHGHSLNGPAVSSRCTSYPVVIMRGGSSAEVVNYSTLAEDLASHGYVVVGFDAPYRTGVVAFPDGRIITRTPQNDPELYSGDQLEDFGNKLVKHWSADCSFALDQLERLNKSDPSGLLTGRLDMSRVGIFGHSLGGAAAFQFCFDDPRCKAGVDLDGRLLGDVSAEGIQKPLMFVFSDHADFSDPTSREFLAKIKSVYERIPANMRCCLVIQGANHFLYSDDGALLKSGVLRSALRLTGLLRIDGQRQLAVTAYCVRSFFDAYLKGEGSIPPQIASPEYPEVRIFDFEQPAGSIQPH